MMSSDDLIAAVNEKNNRAEYQAALDLAEQALKEQSTDYAVWIGAGNAYYGLKRFDEAEKAYLKAISLSSTDVIALANLAGVYFETSRFEEGLSVCDQALARQPDYVNALIHRGNMLSSLNKGAEAIESYRKALEIKPDDPLVLFNLASALITEKQTDSATEIFGRLLAIDPDNPEYLYSYAQLSEEKEEYERAAETYLRLLQVKEDEMTHVILSGCLYNLQMQGKTEQVLYFADEWLRLFPDNPVALHVLETLKEPESLKRASAAYVRELFDAFADSFDSVLTGLDYQAPALVASAVKSISFKQLPETLDLGCGTGLCAAALKDQNVSWSSLTGVDLSSEMLKKAEQRHLYTELCREDIISFLPSNPNRFDLVVSADVFTYIGDLSKVFSGLFAAVRSGGYIVFTVSENEDENGYALEPSGRFMHGRLYVSKEIEPFFHVEKVQSVTLRQELGKPVSGLLIIGKKI
ncbi:MAG: tetratricopeptide repeat protein [Alphaproteobacteria bacterium]|nr:tetratricopeptide repeat protein [Alphaproteobacteria bacterium]